ncbi:unnamed protein product [Aphanomyces euteiches]
MNERFNLLPERHGDRHISMLSVGDISQVSNVHLIQCKTYILKKVYIICYKTYIQDVVYCTKHFERPERPGGANDEVRHKSIGFTNDTTMRALVLVGLIFAIVAFWAITLTSINSKDSSAKTYETSHREANKIKSIDKKAAAIAFVEKQLQDKPIPGLILSVVYKNQTVIARGFGTKQAGNPNTPVTASSLFQIGSYTKTLVAVAIAKLVDDGLVQWNDPVKQHLPWFRLQDKYAEKYTTLADLLAMNSVFGAFQGDVVWEMSTYPTERELVEHLVFFNTTRRPLRAGYAYSNLNFEVLGQVIEAVTTQTWFNYLQRSILDPLGMNETFGRAKDATNVDDLSYGHLTCGSTILGPYNPLKATQIALGAQDPFLAAGSIFMSANDLSKFALFLLNKGHGVLKSPSLIDDLTTGHVVLPDFVMAALDDGDILGYSFDPDGNTVAAGYGIDVVGKVMFGLDYFSKSGDTIAFKQRNGFVPSQHVGVSLAINAQSKDLPGSAAYFLLDRMRSYLVGLFLDVPPEQLDAMWKQGIAHSETLEPTKPTCDPRIFGNEPWKVDISPALQDKLVGTYVAKDSPLSYGKIQIFKQAKASMLQYGAYTRPLYATNATTTLLWSLDFGAELLPLQIHPDNADNPVVSFSGIDLVRQDDVAEKKAMALAFVEKQLEKSSTPGLLLSIVYKNKTIIARGFGAKQVGNPQTPVTSSSLFQIGSYTKTFVALAIGKLVLDDRRSLHLTVDDRRLNWNDPVKQHLPWFTLQDKYAEKFTTLQDLLAMNSVFGLDQGDQVSGMGVYPAERELVQAFGRLNTTRPLRAGYAYSNLNFNVLGQVLEAVTNQTWFGYIKAVLLDPLGMNETFARPRDAANAAADLSAGHLSCGGKVLGPFDQDNTSIITTVGGMQGLDSSGSIVSSANDLSKLSLFLLSKGHGVYKSPAIIDAITTGHTVLNTLLFVDMDRADALGYTFKPDGSIVAAGFAMDVVGNVMYGHDFYTKNGDMIAFRQRNGFVPSEGLGVVLASNVQPTDGAKSPSNFLLDRIRAYLLGIFLDVPTDHLDALWNQGVADAPDAETPFEACDGHYFKGEPWETPGVVIPSEVQDALVGAYVSTDSPDYYGKVTIAKQENDRLVLTWGIYSKPLVATKDPSTFIWALDYGGNTIAVNVTGVNSSRPKLALYNLDFIRAL